MKSQQRSPKLMFFAYQGKSKDVADENVAAIKTAISNYNQFQHNYEAKSWEDFKTTNFISKEILKAINDCEVFVSDITYFNHNVLFELGMQLQNEKK